VAQRNLLKLMREPATLTFTFVQPIMFVLLFRYVFGGAIPVKPIYGGYVNYLLPGILVQTTIFGSINTSIGLAEDLQAGFIERFRALPMARMAVLAGRTASELVRNILVIMIITGMGIAVGFRPGGGAVDYAAACLLMLGFAYCLSWAFAFIGLSAPNAEAAQAMAFPLIFPLTFASGIFVPVQTMPVWLKGFATYQPVSATTAAVRGLMDGTGHGIATWQTIAWSIGAVLVLAPISIRAYRRVR
jgi:ABC-2 type transport system permease protein/oleandomycin transport system permease protein